MFFLPSGQGNYIPGESEDDHAGMRLGGGSAELWQFLFFGCPEGMAFGQSHEGKNLECPIRGTGRVVRFAHVQVGISVTNRQHTVAMSNRLFRPPTQMP